jgi:hypothetical protein
VKGRGEGRTIVRIACALSVIGLLGRQARGAEPSHVLVEGPTDDPVTQRLVSELRASGLVVATTEPTALAAPAAANGSGSDAIVRVVPGVAVRVWWVDRGVVVAGEPEIMEAHPGEDPAISAVRTAEVVRARLLPVERSTTAIAPRAPPAADAPLPFPSDGARPVAPQAASAMSRARFGLDAGGLALFSTGSVPPAFDLALMVRWLPFDRLAVRGLVAVPLVLASVASTEGKASVGEWLAGGTVEWSLLPIESAWAAGVGAGAAGARIQTQGQARAPFVSARGDAWTLLPFVDASASRSLGSPHVRLGVQVLLGTATPPIALRFADRQAAEWGGLVVGVDLGLQVNAY